jgi:hypothetical protein
MISLSKPDMDIIKQSPPYYKCQDGTAIRVIPPMTAEQAAASCIKGVPVLSSSVEIVICCLAVVAVKAFFEINQSH